MAGYTRQSAADIIPTSVVRAAPINAELNALRDAFLLTTGHKHDGSSSEGGYIPLIADSDANNKVSVDTSNNKISVFVEVGSSAVEQLAFQDGSILPAANNDIDLGSGPFKFKNLYLSGTADIATLFAASATLTTADINGGTIDGTVIGGTTAAAITGTVITATDQFTGDLVGDVTGNVTGNLTGNVTGDVTGNLSGNVTSAGTSSFQNVTVGSSLDMGSNPINNLPSPVGSANPATKGYVDSVFGTTQAAEDSASDAEKLAINPENVSYTLSDGSTTGFSALHYAAKAEDFANSAAASYDNFDDRYLGSKAYAPSVDNDGEALLVGAIYWDTTENQLKIYDGFLWQNAVFNTAGAVILSNWTITESGGSLFFASGGSNKMELDSEGNIDLAGAVNGSLGETTGFSTFNLSSASAFTYTPTTDTEFFFTQPPADGVVFEFSLRLTGADVPSGYNLASASYEGVSYSLAEDTGTNDFVFSPDGTKLFMVGFEGEKVYQYSLSTPFDITAITYDSVSLDVSTLGTDPRALKFNPTGTKLYVLEKATSTVYQYSLSTAFDLSTATLSGGNFDFSAKTGQGVNFQFNRDGTKIYLVDLSSVFQYSLSTAFDVSTATDDLITYNFTSQGGLGRSLEFNLDGTKMYILQAANDSVYQYSLSAAFDLSTATYDSVSFSFATEDGLPRTALFVKGGTKIIFLGASSDSLYQYDTSGATGRAAFTYPAEVKWPGGTQPTDPGAGQTDLLKFYTDDGGNTYYGHLVGDNFS